MSGLAEKGDVEDILGIKMPEGEYNSIGGFMCMTIDRIPVIGEAATVETAAERIRFEIAGVDDRRVLSVEAFRSGKDGKSDEVAEDDAQEKTTTPPCPVILIGGIFVLGILCFFGIFLLWSGCVRGLSAFGLLAFWPWPLDFLQPRGLEHTAFLSCMASWLLGFLGFLTFRPLGFLLGVSTSYNSRLIAHVFSFLFSWPVFVRTAP